MDLDVFIIMVFCLIDGAMKILFKDQKLRERGPDPLLTDSEVITMEVAGEYLGLDQDQEMFKYFRSHYATLFPALRPIHRTTFTRQAANLWQVKESIWQFVTGIIKYDSGLDILDSLPIPVCQFARAYRCQLFRGKAAFGKDMLIRQTFYGFRIHVRLSWPGVITRFALVPANIHELDAVYELVRGQCGLTLGDRNYWSPKVKDELSSLGVRLEASFRKASHDPWPRRSSVLSRFRYRIDTVFSQMTQRYRIKKVWARDLWHLQSRLLRKILSHTLAVLFNFAGAGRVARLRRPGRSRLIGISASSGPAA